MVTTTSSQTFSLQANASKVVKEINWPLLTSIAFHGVFFTVVFPQWQDYNSSKANNGLDNTPIVQLNAIEQTRLPNLTPQTSFNWDSLNTLPQGDTSLPSIPLSALDIPTPPPMANFPMPSFDNSVFMDLPAPPSLPPAVSLPPVSYSDNFYLPTPSIPSPTELPPPPPLNQNAIATLPPAINFDTPKDGNIIDITADPTNERAITPEESIIRQQIFANSEIEITANPRDVINGKVNYTPQIRGENDPPLAFQPNASLVAKLQKETQNTSDEDARKNYVAWATQVQNVTPQQLTLSGIYPKDACVGKLEGTAAYGVTVDSAGSVVNTQLIKSSGYPLFNDQALRQIRSHGFANDTGTNKPYHVYVNYNYNAQICPSLSISNVGNTPQNSIEPNPPATFTPPKTESNTVIPRNSIEPNQPNTSKPPATFSIPKTESNPPKPETNIDVKPVQEKPAPSAVVTPEKPPEITPVVPQPTLPELKPLIENKAPSSQKTLEIETSPSPVTQE
ncbi:TonB family protein [Geminocystis herdmanii]|uniref:TonB family protein n=1 Tax=Geminocystis herdmanii TaxID=669359 RepID=UPI00035F2FDB|nr:TonB family protein [Geminocystis herdmanii]